ncbi:sodium-independent sulfate anion transporter-like [Spodoptera frugiperda]|uniref:Sodium-independent sulfate anion transporter-like n=1 Tax=Spodoptera frugiperda TaxID=7108 RepID=A0A9R0F3U7_SPOFR|nr:sodium-independent sulfate anion transporter-like [Spodoptera frugiperda]
MTVINPEEPKNVFRRKAKKWVRKTCSVEVVKKRLPIISWLPKYRSEYFIQDVIAGITVGLTAIPQGIAYAVIAGLSPEYGLYASLTSGVIYVIFGSCYNVTVGPTAILAAMTAKYVVDYSADFAILTAFLSGVFMFIMGILNLGFLVEFISMPVISGFTTAAALQIAAAQLKSFFGLSGSSGNYFAESVKNFVFNIGTIQLWETVLSSATIVMLILLKKMGEGCKRTDGFFKQMRWFISLSRNAVVVVIGMIIAYVIREMFERDTLAVIGDIGSGLPKFGLPPFSTVVGDQTYNFIDMVKVLGVQCVVIPFVAILETIAIAKAFAEGGRIDATQEMIAVGLCNIVGSFGQSMPITGSFTRTALNHVSGVKTPAGGVTKVLLLFVALTYLTSTFYYIPKASLAGLIITAMFSMIDYQMFANLWKNSIKEFMLMLKTLSFCLFYGLEYGIIAGILIEACMLLYNVARPTVEVNVQKGEKGDLMVVTLSENVSYCAAEHLRQRIMKATSLDNTHVPIIVDGANLKKLDYTAAYNLMAIIKDLDKTHQILLLNFDPEIKKLCVYMETRFESKFVYAASPQELTDIFPKDV